MSRRSVAAAALLAGMAIGTAAAADTSRSASAAKVGWDVAIDCATWRFNGGLTFDQAGRGDGFIASGRLFPYGSLPSGEFTPDSARSVGQWVERGVMAATVAEIDNGARPAFFATWYHLPDDGSGIVAEGPHPESGPMASPGAWAGSAGPAGSSTTRSSGGTRPAAPTSGSGSRSSGRLR